MTDSVSNQSPTKWPLNWPHAYGEPPLSGVIRSTPEDFQVDELLGFEPDGDGTHAFLKIQKRNSNTEWVAKQLARHAGVRPVDVGYAGLKDRRAVTTQWFSVDLARVEEPDWRALESDDLKFIEITRHQRKLKRGALQGNRFGIVVRDIEGNHDLFERRVVEIAAMGVPNYFGEQRFGFSNLEKASAMFEGKLKRVKRPDRSLYLSAARSWLFNKILAVRVKQGSWNRALVGDVMMLDGSQSIFPVGAVDEEIEQRVADKDIHPTGAMWGSRALASAMEVGVLERSAVEGDALFCDGLERAGLKQQRRALRLMPNGLEFEWLDGNAVKLRFSLVTGSYATVVLRELFKFDL